MTPLLRLLLLQSLAVQSGALSTSPSLRGRPATRPSRLPSRLSSPVASESLAVTTAKACIGLAAQPVVWWSLATLKTTGCGLAGSTVQSLEGVAYLVVAAFALAGLTTRVRKGGAGLAAAELAAAEAEGSAFAAATAAAADDDTAVVETLATVEALVARASRLGVTRPLRWFVNPSSLRRSEHRI